MTGQTMGASVDDGKTTEVVQLSSSRSFERPDGGRRGHRKCDAVPDGYHGDWGTEEAPSGLRDPNPASELS